MLHTTSFLDYRPAMTPKQELIYLMDRYIIAKDTTKNGNKKPSYEFCKLHIAGQRCKRGSSCAFAHDLRALIPKAREIESFKVSPCRKWKCSYGGRCIFLHSESKHTISDKYVFYYSEKTSLSMQPVKIPKMENLSFMYIHFQHSTKDLIMD
eukprot:UN29787